MSGIASFLSSRLFLVVGLILFIIAFILLNRSILKCERCGKGKMKEISSEPDGVVETKSQNLSSHGGHRFGTVPGSVKVRTKVLYKCEECGHTREATENR